MPVSIGTTTITALFLGTTSITSAYLGSTQVFGGASAFSPLSLFSGGAQGVWYDPSDLTTMFVDRAGTTPVTAPGQLVGLRLDKSKALALGAELVVNGTFDTDVTGWAAANGGTLSWDAQRAKVVVSNVGQGVTQTSWSPVAGRWYRVTFTITNGAAVARNFALTFGGFALDNQPINAGQSQTFTVTCLTNSTANLIIRNAGGTFVSGETFFYDNISVRELPGNHAVAPTDAARPMYGVEPKGGRRNLLLATDTLATQSLTVTAVAHTLAFTGTGTVTLSGASTAGPLVGTGAGNRVSLTFTPTAASLTLTVSGSVTLGQLELGSSATAYQKVVTAEDVTEAGVPTCHYCRYDGANNSMSTAAIDFTATDKMSVFAGVRKSGSDGMMLELSSSAFSNAGSFAMFPGAYGVGGSDYAFASGGTTRTPVDYEAGVSVPYYGLMTGLGDISGNLNRMRVNGIQVGQSVSSLGTGNFGNYPLYLGRRGSTTFPFNGRDFGIVVVGKAASAGEITDTETWLAAKTSGVTL